MDNFTNRGLGALPSEPDPRDYRLPSKAGAERRTFPKSYNSLENMDYAIKDQGRINSCVGHSVSSAIEIAYFRQTGKYLSRSPGFVYGNRPSDVTSYKGEGYYNRDALKGAQKYGVVVQEDFTYNLEVPAIISKVETNKATLYPKAKKVKIRSYYDVMNPNPNVPPEGFCALNEASTKAAIMDYGFVVASVLVFEHWYKVNKYNTVLPIPDMNKEKLYGGHSIILVGWTKDNNWIIANSWGKSYGDNGFVYAPIDYPFMEAWTFDGLVLEGEQEPPKPSGATGWYKQSGKWRYRENGVDVTGWKQVQGVWYYLKSDGYMATGWIKDKGEWYFLNENGSMAIGWKKLDGRWYWFDNTGEAARGFRTIAGKDYYFAEKWFENVKECQLIQTDENGAIIS